MSEHTRLQASSLEPFFSFFYFEINTFRLISTREFVMPIACTRCGAKEEGEILSAPIAFAFKHEKGCGHGVGPLVVIRGKVAKVEEKPKEQVEEIKVEETEQPKGRKRKFR